MIALLIIMVNNVYVLKFKLAKKHGLIC